MFCVEKVQLCGAQCGEAAAARRAKKNIAVLNGLTQTSMC